jgi:hypothetical protein
MQLMLITGLVVIGCALSARFLPNPPPEAQSSPGSSVLSIEGIQLGERHLHARPDARLAGHGEGTTGTVFVWCSKRHDRDDWYANVVQERVVKVSGDQLELGGQPLLKKGADMKAAVLALDRLRLSAPGTLSKSSFSKSREVEGSWFWEYRGGLLEIEFHGSHGEIISALALYHISALALYHRDRRARHGPAL